MRDFIAQLMSLGNNAKALQPESFAQEMAASLEDAALMYAK